MVESCRCRVGVSASAQPIRRLFGLFDRAAPISRKRHYLGTMNKANAGERQQLWLSRTPLRQKVGPLARSINRKDLLAARYHAAVDETCDKRRNVAGAGRDHCFVEKRQTVGDVAELEKCAPLNTPRKDDQVVILVSLTNRGRIHSCFSGSCEVSRVHPDVGQWQQKITLLGAIFDTFNVTTASR